MTRKEIAAILAENPGKELYATYTVPTNVGSVGFFDRISKTRAIRNATRIKEAKYGTYSEFRPDLERYFLRGMNGSEQIVVFFL